MRKTDRQHGAGQQSTPLRISFLRRCGLEDFDEFDPGAEVESPRSLAACATEGIRPQDLTYVPPEAFCKPDVSPEVAALRAEYFEAYRQDLLALARNALRAALRGDTAPHAASPRADPGSAYRHACEFFKEKFTALDLKIIPVKPDWSTSPRNPDFKRIDPFGTATSPGATMGPRNIPAFMESGKSLSDGRPGTAAEGRMTGESWWSVGASSWRTEPSEAALTDMLEQIRDAPGSDWREMDAARRMEDTFGSRRQNEVKTLSNRHSDDKRLLEKRKVTMVKSYEKLEFNQRYNDRLREIREAMAPPIAKAGNTAGQGRARKNNTRMTQAFETRRREYFDERIKKDHALQRQQDEQAFSTKIKFAQLTLEDRVRWRHNYAVVVDTLAEERAGVIEDFRRKQAQLDAAGDRAAAVGALKIEVCNLRRTHRLLDEYRRRRKEEYDHTQEKLKLKLLGERRIERTGGRISAPRPLSPAALLCPATSAPQSPAASLAPLSPTGAAPTPPLSPAAGMFGSLEDIGRMDSAEMAMALDCEGQLSAQDRDWMRSVRTAGLMRARTSPKALSRCATAPGASLPAVG